MHERKKEKSRIRKGGCSRRGMGKPTVQQVWSSIFKIKSSLYSCVVRVGWDSSRGFRRAGGVESRGRDRTDIGRMFTDES